MAKTGRIYGKIPVYLNCNIHWKKLILIILISMLTEDASALSDMTVTLFGD